MFIIRRTRLKTEKKTLMVKIEPLADLDMFSVLALR